MSEWVIGREVVIIFLVALCAFFIQSASHRAMHPRRSRSMSLIKSVKSVFGKRDGSGLQRKDGLTSSTKCSSGHTTMQCDVIQAWQI